MDDAGSRQAGTKLVLLCVILSFFCFIKYSYRYTCANNHVYGLLFEVLSPASCHVNHTEFTYVIVSIYM